MSPTKTQDLVIEEFYSVPTLTELQKMQGGNSMDFKKCTDLNFVSFYCYFHKSLGGVGQLWRLMAILVFQASDLKIKI